MNSKFWSWIFLDQTRIAWHRIVILLIFLWITGGFKNRLIPKAEIYYPMSLCVTVKLQLLVSTKQKCWVSLPQFFVEMLAVCIQLFWDELCHLKPIRLIDCVCVMVNGSVGLVPLFINSVFNLAERFTHLFIFHFGGWLRFIVAGGTIWLNYPKATGSSRFFFFNKKKNNTGWEHWNGQKHSPVKNNRCWECRLCLTECQAVHEEF